MTVTRWRWGLVVLGAVAGLLAVAPSVSAHTGQELNGVWSGLLHPILGPDHLLAMITVGVLAYVMGRDIALPAAFVGAMAAGGLVGVAGVTLPFGEAAVALSVVLLGAALVAGTTMHRGGALVLVGAAGLVHGHAHGLEVPAATHPAVYIARFVVAKVALHAAGWLVGSATARRRTAQAAMGAAVLGAGVGMAAGIL